MGEITLKNGKELPKNPNLKKKHYWWKYLLFFFGGFLACIGVIVGGTAVTGTMFKTRDVLTMMGQNPDEVLGIEYQNDTILSMVMKLTQQKFETLGDIDRVTPLVSKTVNETLNPILSENLHYEFDWNELKTKPFALDPSSTRPEEEYDHTESIGDYIPRALKSGITIASFLQGEINTIVKYFLYPQNPDGSFDTEHPYSINDLLSSGSSFFNDIINKIKIGDIIDTSGNPFLSQIADWGVNDFTDAKIRSLEIAPLFDQETINNNPLLSAIASHNWTIADLSNMDNINTLKIGELIDTSGMTSGIVYALKDKSIADLQAPGFINTIALGDIFNTTEGIMGILVSKGFTVGDLSDDSKIKALTLDEILGGIPTDSILYQFRNTALQDVNNIDVSSVKLTAVLDLETQIKTNNILNAIWEADHDVTVGDLSDPDLINGLKLKAVFPSATGVLKTLADKNYTIGDLSNGSVIDNLTLDDVVGPIDENSILYSFKDTKLSAVDTIDIAGVKLTQVLDLETEIKTNKILNALWSSNHDVTIGDLKSESTITGLLISDIFPSATGVLAVLAGKGYTINDLTNASTIDNLTLDEVLGGISSDSVLYEFRTKTLSELDDIDISSVKLTSVLDLETQIKTNNILNAIWEDNNDVTIGNLSDPDLINGLKLSAVFPSATGILKTLADKNYTIGDLSDGGVIDNLTLDDVVGPIDSSNILFNFKDTPLNEVDTIDIATVKLTQVLDLETEIKTNKILNALWENDHDITVGGLKNENIIMNLLISDIFPSATGVMGVLAAEGYTINDLTNASTIDNLTLDQILGGISADNVLYQYRDTKLGEIDSIDFKAAKLTSLLDLETEIKTNKILNALWESNHDITVGELCEPDTIFGLAIDDVINCSGSQVLESLAAKGATIETLGEKIEELTLVDVVDVGTDPTSIIYKIAHSTALSGKPITEIGSCFENLLIGDILNVSSTSPTVLKTLQNVALKDLGAKMTHLTAKEVIDIDTSPSSTDPLKAIADVEINDGASLMSALKSGLKLKDVTTINGSSPEVLQSLAECTLDEIPTVLTTLSLKEVISIDLTDPSTPQILKSLADVTVFGTGTNNLNYKLTHLKFNDYFTESDCSSGILKVLWESTTPGGDFGIDEVASKINGLKLVDVLGDKIYEDEDPTKQITGTWWYLLTEYGETFTPSEYRYTLKKGATYTINDMDKLVKNMEDHMKNDKIRDLVDAGFITISDSSKLDDPIQIKYYGSTIQPFGSKLLGDYTLNEIFALFMSV